MKELVIWGASGHALVVLDIAVLSGWRILYFVDDVTETAPRTIQEIPVLRAPRPTSRDVYGIVAIGNNAARGRVARMLEHRWETRLMPMVLRHPSAVVNCDAAGRGSVVAAGAVVGVRARLGDNVIVNTGATVDHECVLGSEVHIAPGAHLAGNVHVGDRTLIGMGAVVLPKVKIGKDVVIGAGAVVLHDVPDDVTMIGNPARLVERT